MAVFCKHFNSIPKPNKVHGQTILQINMSTIMQSSDDFVMIILSVQKSTHYIATSDFALVVDQAYKNNFPIFVAFIR